MKQHLEIEYKTMLSHDDVQRLIDTGMFKEPVFQRNDYYDTPNRDLFKKGVMCRIRSFERDDYYEFTLKIPQEDGVMEHELILDNLDLTHASIDKLLQSFGVDVKDLEIITFSETHRRIFVDTYGEWCLDHNQFKDFEDYELEYELHGAHEKAYDHYLKLMDAWGIPYIKSEPKYIRALKSIK